MDNKIVDRWSSKYICDREIVNSHKRNLNGMHISMSIVSFSQISKALFNTSEYTNNITALKLNRYSTKHPVSNKHVRSSQCNGNV